MSSVSLPLIPAMNRTSSLDVKEGKEPQKKENKLPPKDQQTLERAAAPKHWGASMAKTLRGMVSSEDASVDKLKDAAKKALELYNTDPLEQNKEENKKKFIDAFQALNRKAPEAELPSANPSWGQMDNPAYGKFMKKTEKLRAAYKILNTPEPQADL